MQIRPPAVVKYAKQSPIAASNVEQCPGRIRMSLYQRKKVNVTTILAKEFGDFGLFPLCPAHKGECFANQRRNHVGCELMQGSITTEVWVVEGTL